MKKGKKAEDMNFLFAGFFFFFCYVLKFCEVTYETDGKVMYFFLS